MPTRVRDFLGDNFTGSLFSSLASKFRARTVNFAGLDFVRDFIGLLERVGEKFNLRKLGDFVGDDLVLTRDSVLTTFSVVLTGDSVLLTGEKFKLLATLGLHNRVFRGEEYDVKSVKGDFSGDCET